MAPFGPIYWLIGVLVFLIVLFALLKFLGALV